MLLSPNWIHPAHCCTSINDVVCHGIPDRQRLLRDGDIITIDAVAGTIDVKLTDAELAERKKDWKPREVDFTSGYLWKYAQQVGPAVNGAVTHPGGAAEKLT